MVKVMQRRRLSMLMLFQKDPEFYEFTRSIKGYTSTFQNKADVLLIDPKSDYFKYLNKSDGTQKP